MVETNDESRAIYNKNNQIIFKTSMLRSNLCDYSDAYILVKRTITVEKQADAAPNNSSKKLTKNCLPFNSCINRINNTQINATQYIDAVTPMYNLI